MFKLIKILTVHVFVNKMAEQLIELIFSKTDKESTNGNHNFKDWFIKLFEVRFFFITYIILYLNKIIY